MDRLDGYLSVIDKLETWARPAVISKIAREEREFPDLVSLLRLNYRLPPESTHSFFEPGDSIAGGRYQILGKLGQGGMGVVYRARHQHTTKEVAIKLVHSHLMAGLKAGSELSRRFQREIEILGDLNHPGIVSVYDADWISLRNSEDRVLFFAMELVEGTSLEDYLRAERLSWREIVRLMAAICDAVHHAHENGVVHRDLKPANIVIRKDGSPVVLDFGLANASLDALGTESSFMLSGTPQYMSPEQLAPAEFPRGADGRTSDIYSLGVVSYEALVGKRFRTISKDVPLREIRRSILEELPKRVEIPVSHRRLRRAVVRALACEPEQRFASAADFGTALSKASEPLFNWRWAASSVFVAVGIAGGTFYFNATQEGKLGRLRLDIEAANLAGDVTKVLELVPEANRVGVDVLTLRGAVAKALALEQDPTGSWVDRKEALVDTRVLSSDGRFVAVAVEDHLEIRDVASGDLVVDLYSEHRDEPYRPASRRFGAICFSPDSTRVASSSDDSHHVLVWDIGSGTLGSVLYHASPISALQWEPDGTIVSGAIDGTLYEWEDRPLDERFRDVADRVSGIGFPQRILSLDSRSADDTIAVLTPYGAFLFDRSSESIRARHPLENHTFHAVELDPILPKIELLGDGVREIRWGPQSVAFEMPLTQAPRAIAVCPGGRCVAFSDSQGISVVDAIHERIVTSVEATLAGGVAVSFDDPALYLVDRDGIHRWILEQGRGRRSAEALRLSFAHATIGIAEAPDWGWLATPAKLHKIDLSALFSGAEVGGDWELASVGVANAGRSYSAVEAAANGAFVAVGTNASAGQPPDPEFRVYDSQLTLIRVFEDCQSVVFTGDSRSLLCLGLDGTFREFGVPEWDEPRSVRRGIQGHMALSGNDRYLLTGASTGELELRSYPSLELLTTLAYRVNDPVVSLSLSEDGGLAVAVTENHSLVIWRIDQLFDQFSDLELAWVPTGPYRERSAVPSLEFLE